VRKRALASASKFWRGLVFFLEDLWLLFGPSSSGRQRPGGDDEGGGNKAQQQKKSADAAARLKKKADKTEKVLYDLAASLVTAFVDAAAAAAQLPAKTTSSKPSKKKLAAFTAAASALANEVSAGADLLDTTLDSLASLRSRPLLVTALRPHVQPPLATDFAVTKDDDLRAALTAIWPPLAADSAWV